MSRENLRICENGQLAAGFLPVNMATAANTGAFVSMKNYKHCAIVLYKDGGASGEDPTITVQQATAVAGTSAKALTFTDIYTKQGSDVTAVAQFTRTTQTAASTYTSATSGEQESIWVIEFDSNDLDVANGFDCIQAAVADVGSTSQIGCLLYILTEPRYAEEPTPGVIAD
jgi:hypothetical protein